MLNPMNYYLNCHFNLHKLLKQHIKDKPNINQHNFNCEFKSNQADINNSVYLNVFAVIFVTNKQQHNQLLLQVLPA